MKKLGLLLWVLLLLPAAAFPQEGTDLLKTVDRNLQPESYESYRKLINIEPGGKQREFILFTVKKGNDKVASLFLSPASEKGRSTLRLGDNMWLYIPNVAKPLRITSLQSVVGGVFNNADIMRLDFHVEYNVEKVEDAGQETVLELKAKTGAVAYDRLKMWVDKKAVLPTRIECYAATGLLIKTLYFKDRKAFEDGKTRPALIETESPLYKGHKSLMIYASLKPRNLADEVFSLNFLSKLESVR